MKEANEFWCLEGALTGFRDTKFHWLPVQNGQRECCAKIMFSKYCQNPQCNIYMSFSTPNKQQN